MNLVRRIRRYLPFPRRRTLRRWFPPFELRNLEHLIALCGADLVVDIGANAGQYVTGLRSVGCHGPFLSIEPQAAAHRALCASAAGHPGWQVAPPMALGAQSGHALLHRYADDTLSSLLRPEARHLASPAMAPMGTERVALRRLDDVMAELAPQARQPFVKLDVQGAERAVLAGGPQTFARAAGVQVELALSAGYEGEAGYLEILGALDAFGLVPVYAMKVVTRRRLGPWAQMDMVLLRRDP